MLPFSDACERNKHPILAVLRRALAPHHEVLEIGSGTGQHAVFFSAELPQLVWHPTERLDGIADLAARISSEGGPNLRAPQMLDVSQALWPPVSADAVFTANTLHIMGWADVISLFRGIGSVLAPGGVLCIYGPFRYDGTYTSPSNRDFDDMLRARDSDSGLRDIEAVAELAASVGLKLTEDHDLPAFNRLLILKKEPV